MPREGKPNIGIIELIEPHVVNLSSGSQATGSPGTTCKTFRFNLISQLFANHHGPWGGRHGHLPCCMWNVLKNVHVTFKSGVYTIYTGKSATICNKPGVNNCGVAISCRNPEYTGYGRWEFPQMEIIKVLLIGISKCFKILRHFPMTAVSMQKHDTEVVNLEI